MYKRFNNTRILSVLNSIFIILLFVEAYVEILKKA